MERLKAPRERTIRGTVVAMATSLYTAALTAGVALAAGGAAGAIEAGVKNGAQQMWNILTAIVTPIAAVALAINVFKLIWGSSKDADAAKNKVAMLIVAIAVVFLAPVIVSQVSGWFSGSGWVF